LNWLLRVGESTEGLPNYLTYSQNIQLYWGGDPPEFIRAFGHTWTLALEEQYYLIWPLVVYFSGRRMIIAISLAAFASSIAARTGGLSGTLLAARCDGLALGGILAVLLSQKEIGAAWRARCASFFGVVLASALLAMVMIISGVWNTAEKISIFSIAFFGLIGLIVLFSGERWLAFLRMPALMFVGTISYGLYLYHIPVDRGVEILLRRIGIRHFLNVGYPIWRTGLEFGLAFFVAVLSWNLIEKPILGLRSRFNYRGDDG